MLYVFVWVMLYGGMHIISKLISQTLHIAQWGTAFAMLLYVCLFMAWIYMTGRSREISLCIRKCSKGLEYLYMLPLFVLPLFNVIIGEGVRITFPTAIYMISISIVEELFFRGFLLHYLLKRSKICGIVVSSTLFAGFHLINLFQYKDSVYILCQVLCAFVVGICYSAIVVRYNSLLPCFIAHSLTNITGLSVMVANNFYEIIYGLFICIAVYVGYGVFICREIR